MTTRALNQAVIRAFKPIPGQMRNTLRLDNGKEAPKSLPQAQDLYFAHPYHPGEPGLNKHP
ncbi:MAG: hypothetical protein LBB80_00190 [Treponema sp.]|jgi:IS30 family transposase|nr:hypothetical protein [Treponema sp.]